MIDYNIDGMNKKIVEANTKLVDENRWLKEDMERLKLRMQRTKKFIEENRDMMNWVHCLDRDLLDLLEGRYVDEQ